MSKWVTFSLYGTMYAVPASVIANNYVDYYKDSDRGTSEELYDEIISDDEQLIDWAQGNMNPDDFGGSEVLIRVSTPPFNEVFFGMDNYVEVVNSDPRCATK